MINSIIEASSVSLNEEFGDDYEIHEERRTAQDGGAAAFYLLPVQSPPLPDCL